MTHMRSKAKGARWTAGVVCLVALFALSTAAWMSQVPGVSADETRASIEASDATSYARALSTAFRQTAEEVLPSVVMIRTTSQMTMQREGPRGPRQQQPSPDDLEEFFRNSPFEHFFRQHPDLRRFFDEPRIRPNSLSRGIGSGVIIDASGIILTNYHVVRGGGDIMVHLHDGRQYQASDVKGDPKTDLAVVRIEGAEGLKPARLGDSDQVAIGEWALALGQPFGLEGSVTAGIISAKGRGLGIADREDFLQTDAAINPGNSGGPLVNLDGEVIGINTAISSSTGGNQGVGFAVPINLAKWVMDQLIETGSVQRAFLGVGIQPVDHELAEQFGIDPRKGVVVTEVRDGTPADEAGIEPGDVIVEFGGKPIHSPRQLQLAVEQSAVGQEQSVELLRDGQQLTLSVVCRERTEEEVAAMQPGVQQPSSQFESLGLEVSELTEDVAEQLELDATQGAVVTNVRPDSPAARAGLEAGMVIVQADRKQVETVQDLEEILQQHDGESGLLLLVKSPQGSRFVVVRP